MRQLQQRRSGHDNTQLTNANFGATIAACSPPSATRGIAAPAGLFFGKRRGEGLPGLVSACPRVTSVPLPASSSPPRTRKARRGRHPGRPRAEGGPGPLHDQRLVSALPLARRIAEQAYKAGAGLVTTMFSDEDMTLARYRNGRDLSFDRAAGWFYDGVARAFGENTARLAIAGDNPMLLAEQDTDKVGRANRAMSKAYKPAQSKIVNFDINWTIVPYPGAAWARQVFPGRSPKRRPRSASSPTRSSPRPASRSHDPRSPAWAEHNARLRSSARHWPDRQELPLERSNILRPGHRPRTSGSPTATPGRAARSTVAQRHHLQTPISRPRKCSTTPHRLRVDGRRPLHQAALPQRHADRPNIEVRFEAGRIVEVHARRGEDVLVKAMDTDEGWPAHRRSGAGAAPRRRSRPAASCSSTRCSTRNAASHIALGQCYSKCFVESDNHHARAGRAQRGGNTSNIHIDWMIELWPGDRHRRHRSAGRRRHPRHAQGRVGLTTS